MSDETTNSQVQAVYPRLVVSDAARAIAFYVEALGAEEVARYVDGAGKIAQAEILIGGVPVAVKDEGVDQSPTSLGGTSVIMSVHVDDADAAAERMIAAGASVVFPIADQHYGERAGRVQDPFGHQWMISHHIEDLTVAEIQERTAQL